MPATVEQAAETPDKNLERLQIKVGGMACSFCVASVEKAIGRLSGVEEVHVNLGHEEALVAFDPAVQTEFKIKDTLRALGYVVRDPRKVEALEEERRLIVRLRANTFRAIWLSSGLLLLMAAMWAHLLKPAVAMRPITVINGLVAGYVIFFLAWHILTTAFQSLRRGILNQHVLLAFGALGAYTAGILGVFLPRFPAPDFFATGSLLATYHLVSGYVSTLVRTRASESVRKLLALQPDTAVVVRDGRETEVTLESVRVGDLVRVRPGERIPVDGLVHSGHGAVDLAMVTGEPVPVDVGPGSEVIGGAVNVTGGLLVEATRVGEESFVRRVAKHVEEAKALKPGIIQLVDRILVVYVPVVLTVAGLSFLGWGLVGHDWTRALYAALSVLVMGYPCALGMATPLALIRGGGMAAERGILMRSGDSFQAYKDIRRVVFDKTGTLTVGAPRVVAVLTAEGTQADNVLRFAAAAEVPSEHPLAKAIVEEARRQGLDPVADLDGFEALAGHGVRATVSGRHVLIGSPRFIAGEGIGLSPLSKAIEASESEGRTMVAVAVDGRLAGAIGLADTLKADARDTVAALQRLHIEPVMITGDNARTAAAVAEALGIKEFRAQVLPQEKAARVRELQAGGVRVAMVGDGINDAPALTQADVGIAIGAGTDIAIEAADVVLVGDRLGPVVDGYHISRNSYRKTAQNLILAFAFNGIGIPLATTGLFHPVWAMGAMVASVSTILLNSFGGRLLPGRPTPSAGGGRDTSNALISPAE